MYRHILNSTFMLLVVAVLTIDAVNYWQIRSGNSNTMKQRNSNKALPMRHFWARGGKPRGVGGGGNKLEVTTEEDYINPFARRQIESPDADQDFGLKYRFRKRPDWNWNDLL